MRELMFRQDQKAKRIAKIKSKAYRKIHKRERERELERRIAEEGSDGEDAREKKMKIETARARERMTLRHKNTGDWARRMLNRGQHDLETRQAISEQVRRGDELQRKILGDDEEDREESDSAEELDDLLEDPNKWGEDQSGEEAPEIRKGVLGMKFMKDAEERQKQLNAERIAEIKAAVDAGSDDDEIIASTAANSRNVNPGRKTFTPGDQVQFRFDVL
jgi:U3 small nucleolar RNA-associated protein 14